MQQQLQDVQSQLSEAQHQLQQAVPAVAQSTQIEVDAEPPPLQKAQGTQTECGDEVGQLALQKRLLKAEVESLKRQVAELTGAMRALRKQQQQVGPFLQPVQS